MTAESSSPPDHKMPGGNPTQLSPESAPAEPRCRGESANRHGFGLYFRRARWLCGCSLFPFPIALLSFCALQISAQTHAINELGPDPVFRANARAVLVDVVVTDSHGNPVPGLRQQDFKLTENGKPESVVFFEEHKGAEVVPIDLPKMPPNVFTNVPVAPQADALNVLLLDALNTPQTDQSYVRAQVLEFLKTMKPGTPLAVFSLATDLRLVQGFTGSPSTLLASLQDKKNGVWPETTAFSHSTKDDMDDRDQVSEEITMLGGHGHTDAGVDALKEHQQNEKVYQAVQRVCTYGRGTREYRSLFGKDSRPQEFDMVRESISGGVFSGCKRERSVAGGPEDRRCRPLQEGSIAKPQVKRDG